MNLAIAGWFENKKNTKSSMAFISSNINKTLLCHTSIFSFFSSPFLSNIVSSFLFFFSLFFPMSTDWQKNVCNFPLGNDPLILHVLLILPFFYSPIPLFGHSFILWFFVFKVSTTEEVIFLSLYLHVTITTLHKII